MFKIAVCDDNQKFLEIAGKTIESFGQQTGEPIVVRTFSDSDELLEMIEENCMFDAYFLDVEMPRHSGMELVEQIRKVTSIPPIVLLTGFDIYAIDACGKNIFKYVLKTTWAEKSYELLAEVVGELKRLKADRIYIINNQRRYVKIPHHQILYIAKEQKNAVFFWKTNDVSSSGKR